MIADWAFLDGEVSYTLALSHDSLALKAHGTTSDQGPPAVLLVQQH